MCKVSLIQRAPFFVILLLLALGAASGKVMAETPRRVFHGKVTINGKNAGHAAVALLNQDGSALPADPVEKTVVQKNLQFSPAFSIVPLASTISFENRDDTVHNVWSGSPTNPFDLGAHLPKTLKQVVLKNKGAVSLRCKVHVEMNAMIYVVASPFFAVTDKHGRFEIKDLPLGSYKIETWHASLAPQEMSSGRRVVEITPDTDEIHLAFKSKAGVLKDLTNVAGKNWRPVIEEIQTALFKAFSSWQNKRTTSAAGKVMTIQSRLYRESGIRDAISNTLGEPRAIDHDNRFDQIRKWVQGITSEVVLESELKKAIQELLANLKEDVQVLQGL